MIRARSRLRQAVQEGRKQAQLQFDGVKARHAALSKLREARLAAIQSEPDAIAVGRAEFITHALIVPSTDPEDIKRFDAQVEAVAIRLSTAHEESAAARVRDVSTAMRARAAGLRTGRALTCCPIVRMNRRVASK